MVDFTTLYWRYWTLMLYSFRFSFRFFSNQPNSAQDFELSQFTLPTVRVSWRFGVSPATQTTRGSFTTFLLHILDWLGWFFTDSTMVNHHKPTILGDFCFTCTFFSSILSKSKIDIMASEPLVSLNAVYETLTSEGSTLGVVWFAIKNNLFTGLKVEWLIC